MSNAQYTCKDCGSASSCGAVGGKPSDCIDFWRKPLATRKQDAIAASDAELQAERNAWRAEMVKSLRDRGTKPLALHLLHGRDTPEENMDDMGYDGGFLFIDWIHITYNSDLVLGAGSIEFIPGQDNVLWMLTDLLALNDGEKTQYFGDWEIVPASEVIL